MKISKQNKREKNIAIKIALMKNRYLMILDVFFVIAAHMVAGVTVGDASDTFALVAANFSATLFSVVIFLLIQYWTGIYSVMWIYGGTRDYLKIIGGGVLASIISCVYNVLFVKDYLLKFSIISVFIIVVAMVASRMFVRAVYNLNKERNAAKGIKQKRLMIVGAGSSAATIMKDLVHCKSSKYEVCCFIDDDPNKHNAYCNGVRIVGDRYDIKRVCKEENIDEILIAIPSATPTQKKEIIEICNETSCKINILPNVDGIIEGSDVQSKIRNVQIEDLLARDPIQLDNTEIKGYIEGRTILVTGGGGSIGSELCRQIMRFKPEKLIVLDIYENNAYDLQMELNRKYPENQPDVVIASVRDIKRLEEIFDKYRPYIVFHAAAHKHVPLMEFSPGEAIKNNVFGTLNVAKCADKYGVKRFVMISTDKAVNPTNIMGATKRVCEMIVQYMQEKSKTEFVAVRFGNVLGSNGSVIPLFKRQIEEGGPVTVTDKRITRFFMTIPEAAQLVLQAASYAKGGEIFVLDMGEPVKIYDLARNLIRLSGYKPDEDIMIEVCGLRPGEKLYEELLMDEEGLTDTSHNKIFIGKPLDINKQELDNMLAELEKASETDDHDYIKEVMSRVVPTYVYKKQEKDKQVV